MTSRHNTSALPDYQAKMRVQSGYRPLSQTARPWAAISCIRHPRTNYRYFDPVDAISCRNFSAVIESHGRLIASFGRYCAQQYGPRKLRSNFGFEVSILNFITLCAKSPARSQQKTPRHGAIASTKDSSLAMVRQYSNSMFESVPMYFR